jgi:hypothetical protein
MLPLASQHDEDDNIAAGYIEIVPRVCPTSGIKLRGPEGAQRLRATSASISELCGARFSVFRRFREKGCPIDALSIQRAICWVRFSMSECIGLPAPRASWLITCNDAREPDARTVQDALREVHRRRSHWASRSKKN